MGKTYKPRATDARDLGADGMPLRAAVEDGKLIVAIGIETLAFAFEKSEENNPYDEHTGDFKEKLRIGDKLQFSDDVVRAMNDEAEDGSTPLTRFIDSMMQEAVNQGSLGILDPEDE
jgi:hypothetical protein